MPQLYSALVLGLCKDSGSPARLLICPAYTDAQGSYDEVHVPHHVSLEYYTVVPGPKVTDRLYGLSESFQKKTKA